MPAQNRVKYYGKAIFRADNLSSISPLGCGGSENIGRSEDRIVRGSADTCPRSYNSREGNHFIFRDFFFRFILLADDFLFIYFYF